MKKLLTICFAVLYTLITSGFTVNVHYCMGERAGMDLYGGHSSKGCGKCGMPVKGDCCKDEAKFVKLENSHQAAQVFAVFNDTFISVPVLLQPLWLQPLAATQVLNVWAPLHAPPLITTAPLYQRYCTFLI